MPGPCAGAPKAVTFCVAVPSPIVDAAVASGAAATTPGHTGHPGQVDLSEWCRPQEWSGRTGLDHERVDTHGIDGSLGFYVEAVRQAGQDERHREDQSGADDRDDEAPPSPLHIA